MDWKTAARQLAGRTAIRPESRWYEPVATTARHRFVPRWWARDTTGDGGQVWHLRDGAADPEAWLRTAYADTTLVTRVGSQHADHAETDGTLARSRALRSTSSSTLPSLILMMYRAAWIQDTSRLLVTCGSGYGTAVACARVGEDRVTSVDVDSYLVESARARLAEAGHHPQVEVGDLTGDLPEGGYDRIISTVALPTVPASWLQALAPGGRLVTTIANTGLVVVADKTPDGGAVGRVAAEAAGFMAVRHGDDYEDTFPESPQLWEMAQHADGDTVTTSRFPLMYVPDTWDVRSTLELLAPGIDHRQQHGADGSRTLYMLHADGSWARATAPDRRASPTVHQGGPRRLWDELDRVRTWLAIDGDLPVRGADVTITPEGVTTFSRQGWSATLS
ncbi:Protein-L-isoaspartate O-methyltransferase [Streptomyces sp. MnatMP-M77]|uniref:methyltransferase domain-containing protein n=1 Tax=unclassified Streptomyces TaxID=2593676 RepID=UPI000805B865|nr:methyltransferase domain-containing protein [Streptomyces sp. MnatMP-M77]MYT82394.1 methyltransferase domain-containing protein [Streptomyces sp. SID8364]SBU96454.1 Protein-L-isoaspartate O-methyltransferase [Streptomyces sp. MnatMP-M77]